MIGQENEQGMNLWLQNEINNGTFKSGSITEVHELLNSGKAHIINADSVEQDIQINPLADSYEYSVIQSLVDNKLKDLVALAASDITKGDSTAYMNERTKKSVALWKDVIANNLFSVPDEIKSGINLLETEDANLNELQLAQKNKVQNWIFKLNARNRIEAEIGDPLDLLSDISKRVSLLERLTIRLSNAVLTGVEMPEPFKTGYTQLCESYIQAVNYGIFKDRTDLEDPQDIFQTLMRRYTQISNIVEEEYFSKKV